MKRETSCGLVVFRQRGAAREFLLIQHSTMKHWEFPKGWPEAGESEEATALRETQEEAGLTGLRIVPGFRERIQYVYRLEGELVRKEVTYFLAEAPADADVRLSWEHSAFVWLPFAEAKERATKENTRELLEKAKVFLDSGQ